MPRLRAKIDAIRSFVPAARLGNDDLARAFPEWPIDKIYEKTGIRTRGVAAADECASDLGVKAAQKLFADGTCGPAEIDFLLFCTQAPDYYLPTSACVMQDRLGLPTTCGALDFNLGCSGFVYGLSLAKGLIESGSARNVLLVTAETYTKYIHPRDKSVRTLFGDAAAATLVRGVEAERPLLGPFVFGTDGRGAQNLIVKTGGLRHPERGAAPDEADASGNVRSADHLYMNGPEIFNFTLRTVPAAVNSLLEKAGVAAGQVDLYVFHQANQYMLEALRRKLDIPKDKFCVEMEATGNTVSATIPLALEAARAGGRVRPGQQTMLVGFGVGYSWAGCLARL